MSGPKTTVWPLEPHTRAKHLILGRLFCGLLVKLQNVDHSLWVFAALLFGNPAFVNQSLPFFWQALSNKLAYLRCNIQPDKKINKRSENDGVQ